jgi:hypothetical protein
MDSDEDCEFGVSSDKDCEFFMRNNMQVNININTVTQAVLAITTIGNRRIRNERAFTGRNMITDILEGHPQRCLDLFQMTPTIFRIMCDEVAQKRTLKINEVSVEEQV